MTTTRTANKDAGQYLRHLRPFTGSNFYGTTSFEGFGRARRDLGHALAIENADYIVYSYATPIAWHIGGSWVMPHDRYSVTTSKHQSIVRKAIS